MKSPLLALRIAGTFLALFAAAHLWRLLRNIDVIIGGRYIPQSVSLLAVIVASALSLWFWSIGPSEP